MEHFRQCDVGGGIRREVAAQLPNPIEERPVWVAFERHLGKRHERLMGALRRHFAACLIAPQGLGNFQVNQVRSVKCFLRVEQAMRKPRTRRPVQQDLDHYRRIQHDHRLSLTWRMI